MNRFERLLEILLIILGIALVLMIWIGEKMIDNNTARFFDGIEIQYETAEQRAVIVQALEDMLVLEEIELKQQVYPDYLRKGDRVEIKQIIYDYFVPDDAEKKLNSDFYQQLKTEEVKAIITDLLHKISEGRSGIGEYGISLYRLEYRNQLW